MTEILSLPFKVVSRADLPVVAVDVEEEIIAKVLDKMKSVSVRPFGKMATHAIVAVFASFNESQRQTINEASAIAELSIPRLIDEPTAAVIAHGLDNISDMCTVLVYDFGGSTFNATVLSVGGGDEVKVLASFVWEVRISIKMRPETEKAKSVFSTQLITEVSVFYIVHFTSKSITRVLFERIVKDLLQKTLGHVEQAL
ncbi:ATPase with role in protein import into the ER [Haplosporangium gracile]|nr:ATPase with role in protein import into the ER [Haplosporangium gracile]